MLNIQIRIRASNDKRNWKDIPVWVSGNYHKNLLDNWLAYYCNSFLQLNSSSVVELRWNEVGSSQGHYYTPKGNK